MPRNRSQIDDHTLPGRLHPRSDRLGAKQEMPKIDRDVRIKGRWRNVIQFVTLIVRRIVDEDLDRPELPLETLEHGANLRDVGQIAPEIPWGLRQARQT